jgi:hypothetical protein
MFTRSLVLAALTALTSTSIACGGGERSSAPQVQAPGVAPAAAPQCAIGTSPGAQCKR